jgi:putative membrane protein insertion efficiency factor
VSTRSVSGASEGNPAGPAARVLLLMIEAYRLLLSPIFGGYCRYQPTCSAYGQEAIRKHGAWRGSRLALRRILRCHPFRPGGYDPVP